MKQAFLLKSNWIGVFDKLSAEKAGLLIKLLYHYNVYGTEPEEIDDEFVSAYFDLMKLDCDAMNYLLEHGLLPDGMEETDE